MVLKDLTCAVVSLFDENPDCGSFKAGVGNLWPVDHIRPARLFSPAFEAIHNYSHKKLIHFKCAIIKNAGVCLSRP